MKRMLSMVVVLVASVGVANGDIPPPKGLKRVPLEHKITTEKAYPDYAFFSQSGDKVVPLKLEPKSSATITTGGGVRYLSAVLVAVPKDAGKKYANEKDFFAAIASAKVEGLIQAPITFNAFTEVKVGDGRKVIEMAYKVEKIDPKEGIVLVEVKKGDPKVPPPPGAPKLGGEEEDSASVNTYAPKGGTWVAGLAGTVAVVLGGLWLTRRGRRDLA